MGLTKGQHQVLGAWYPRPVNLGITRDDRLVRTTLEQEPIIDERLVPACY